MFKRKIYDIVIVGAGPAGCTAALALQNSGLNVLLLEKSVFPRDKVCGDAVSWIARKVLGEINPQYAEELHAFSKKTVISQARVYSPKNDSFDFTFNKNGYCIKRIDFDNFLFEKACTIPSLEIHQNSAIQNLIHGDDFVEITFDSGDVIQAKIVLGCDGANSIVNRKLGSNLLDRKHHSGAVTQYIKNIEGLEHNRLEVYFVKNFLPGYFWIFPVSATEANVGFGMLSETVSKLNIDLKKSFHQIIYETEEISGRFKNAEVTSKVKGFGLPLGSKKRVISGHRFMLCGDAAALIDPFSGEGIEHAMRSGKYAAEMAISCFKENDFSANKLKAYDEIVYKKVWKTFREHYLMQRVLGKREWLVNLIIQFTNIPFVKRQIPKLFY